MDIAPRSDLAGGTPSSSLDATANEHTWPPDHHTYFWPRCMEKVARRMTAGEPSEVIVDCPYCDHAWKVDGRWTYGACPNCGRMVYRYMDPKHD